MTRWDAHKFARDAYNAGIRFIGGCCGIEPYHIRAVAEEVGLVDFNNFRIYMKMCVFNANCYVIPCH